MKERKSADTNNLESRDLPEFAKVLPSGRIGFLFSSTEYKKENTDPLHGSAMWLLDNMKPDEIENVLEAMLDEHGTQAITIPAFRLAYEYLDNEHTNDRYDGDGLINVQLLFADKWDSEQI